MGTIYQSIEILSKEKGIDPQVVLDAVKDAMLTAARKHFRTNEDLVADFDNKLGIQIFAVKRVVDVVEDDAIVFTDWNRLYSLYYVAHVLEGRTEMDFHQYYPQLDPNADISSLLSYIDSQIDSRPIYFTRYPACRTITR